MPLEGYVYVADGSKDAMTQAETGVRIDLAGKQPHFMVVDHCIEAVVIAKWPGRLWRVHILKEMTRADEQACGAVPLAAGVCYTRALAVAVLDEVPTATLFGQSGEAVCKIISQARQIELEQVYALAAARHPEAGVVYARIWRNWLNSVGYVSSTEPPTDVATVSVFVGMGRPKSPLNEGLAVLYQEMINRAHAIAGPSAFLQEEEERYLEPKWSAATKALLEAAMAYGAGQLCKEGDQSILSTAWRSVIGASACKKDLA